MKINDSLRILASDPASFFIVSNNDFLSIISGLGKYNPLGHDYKNTDHYKELSGLPYYDLNTGEKISNYRHVIEITGESSAENIKDALAIWAGIPRTDVDQKADLLQWIAGDWYDVGNFDGQNYITVSKTQEITSDYQCFVEMEISAQSPDVAERIFVIPTTEIGRLYIDALGVVHWLGNGSADLTFGSIGLRDFGTIKLEMKTGFIRVTVNGVANEQVLISTDTTWNSYDISYSSAGFTGILKYWTDCEKTYSPSNLPNEAVLTDPNNVFNDLDVANDKSGHGLYAILDTSTGSINLNPTSDVTLTGRGFTGYQDRVTLAGLNDGTLSFTSDETTPTPPLFKSLQYLGVPALSPEEEIIANEYVEGDPSTTPVPGNAIVNDDGVPIFDDEGNFILAD